MRDKAGKRWDQQQLRTLNTVEVAQLAAQAYADGATAKQLDPNHPRRWEGGLSYKQVAIAHDRLFGRRGRIGLDPQAIFEQVAQVGHHLRYLTELTP